MRFIDRLAEPADRRRYVPLETAERALAMLAAHLREGRSPVLLRGPRGMGKTLLLRVLAEREHGLLQRVRLSQSLRAAGPARDLLLQCLFRRWAPEGTDTEVVLLEQLHGFGAVRMLLPVDLIDRASRESIRRLSRRTQESRRSRSSSPEPPGIGWKPSSPAGSCVCQPASRFS